MWIVGCRRLLPRILSPLFFIILFCFLLTTSSPFPVRFDAAPLLCILGSCPFLFLSRMHSCFCLTLSSCTCHDANTPVLSQGELALSFVVTTTCRHLEAGLRTYLTRRRRPSPALLDKLPITTTCTSVQHPNTPRSSHSIVQHLESHLFVCFLNLLARRTRHTCRARRRSTPDGHASAQRTKFACPSSCPGIFRSTHPRTSPLLDDFYERDDGKRDTRVASHHPSPPSRRVPSCHPP